MAITSKQEKITLRVVPIDENGELKMDVFRSLFNEKTKLVSLSHISNVLGTVNPVKEIISISHSHDVPVLLDGAQAAPHTRIDVQDMDVDFYVLSAHKMYGPTGIGVLYGKEKWLNAMPPYQGGGEMISHVSFEKRHSTNCLINLRPELPTISEQWLSRQPSIISKISG